MRAVAACAACALQWPWPPARDGRLQAEAVGAQGMKSVNSFWTSRMKSSRSSMACAKSSQDRRSSELPEFSSPSDVMDSRLASHSFACPAIRCRKGRAVFAMSPAVRLHCLRCAMRSSARVLARLLFGSAMLRAATACSRRLWVSMRSQCFVAWKSKGAGAWRIRLANSVAKSGFVITLTRRCAFAIDDSNFNFKTCAARASDCSALQAARALQCSHPFPTATASPAIAAEVSMAARARSDSPWGECACFPGA